MTTKQWSDWLISAARSRLPFVHGRRYHVTVAPIKHNPERRFTVTGTFDRALTQLVFVGDDGRERRVNSATIVAVEEVTS